MHISQFACLWIIRNLNVSCHEIYIPKLEIYISRCEIYISQLETSEYPISFDCKSKIIHKVKV